MRIIGLLLLLTILLSCSNSTKPDDNDPFSIRLKLVDNSDNPLQGYRITINQNNYNGTGNDFYANTNHRSYTTFAYYIEGDYKVNLRIYDFFNRPIRTIIDTTQIHGNYHVSWDGKDDEGILVRDGVYKAEIKYYNGEEVVFSDRCYPYILCEFNMEQSHYLTDVNGELFTENIIPFPRLYCNVPVKVLDEQGNEIRDFVFSDTMEVTIESPNQEYRSCIFRIINGKNILNLNWDTMTQVDETTKKTITSTEVNHRKTNIKHTAEPPINQFFGNYPNPFN